MDQTPPLSNATKRAAKVLPTATDAPIFRKEKHISYWMRCLRSPLPQPYTSNDANRMTLAFFTMSALDLLGVLFTRTTKAERDEYIAWIYRCQHPEGGFRAFTGADMGEHRNGENSVWDPANVPATYFALSSLCVLRDDLQRVDRRACLSWLRKVQRPDGSFGQTLGEDDEVLGGMDTRFGYCAMVIRWILRGDQEGEVEGVPDIDATKLARCIRGSETYDGGLADEPFHEAHAGFTYCAIAAAQMIDQVRLPSSTQPRPTASSASEKQCLSDPDLTVRWLLSRLTTFVEEKEEDTDNDTEPDAGMSDDDALSTATDVLQTPNTSFPSSSDGAQMDGAPKNETTSQDRDIMQDGGLQGFHKIRSYPAPPYDGEVANPTAIPPQLAASENLIHAASPPPPEDDDILGQQQWAGFNGRPNKLADTCYVFWVGASLMILRSFYLVDPLPLRHYLLEKTQHLYMGGFGKTTGALPDLFHAYLGLSALSFIGVHPQAERDGRTEPVPGFETRTPVHEGLIADGTGDDQRMVRELDPTLCVSLRTREWIEGLPWRNTNSR